MTKIARRCLLGQSPLTLIPELVPTNRLPLRCLRPFSQSSQKRADSPSQSPRSFPTASPIERSSFPRQSPSLHPKAKGASPLSNLTSFLSSNLNARNSRPDRYDISDISSDGTLLQREREDREPHRFHVYATRHNCHITVTGPKHCVRIKKPDAKDAKKEWLGGILISVSAGNIGFKHSGRKHYDSAFQLASYVMSRMQDAGVSSDVKEMELYLRGFGAGREAVTKALLGSEGRLLRGKIVKVSDATRLKFGGTRSKKPRRLG